MSIIKLQGAYEQSAGIYYTVDTTAEPLGVGGMGTVYPGYRVEANGQQKEAAIKFLYDDLPLSAVARARQEASIQIKNDNLVEMYGYIQIDQPLENGQIKSRGHVVSELLHGVMLFDLLRGVTTGKRNESVPYAQQLYEMSQTNRQKFALTIVKNILSGVMALHDRGYVHRDIDPSNIMVTTDDKIKLIDFGIVKKLSEQGPQLSQVGQFLGKPGYAAPEIVKGYIQDHNFTTDVYSIGIMLFELMTGHLPFVGETDDVIEKQKTMDVPVSEIQNSAVASVIRKATAKRQSERFQTAAEFRVAIDDILSGRSPQATIYNKRVKAEPVTNPVLKWIMVGAAIGLLLGILLAFIIPL